jgi:hypothetical protein
MSNFKKPMARALAELALIFVGITLALAFESWNDNRVERAQERELLRALTADLEETLVDLRRDILDAQSTLASRAEILAWQSGEQLDAVGLQEAFAGAIAGSGLFPKISAYESIKTIGLDLIADPALREAITSVHELTLARALRFEALRNEFEREVFLPYVRTHMDYAGEGGVVEVGRQAGSIPFAPLDLLAPLDESGLRGDPEFRIISREGFSSESGALEAYRRLEAEIESVLGMLGTALEG